MPAMKIKKQPDVYKISSEEEYESAIEKVESLWEARNGSDEAHARDVLVALIEEYETQYEDLT